MFSRLTDQLHQKKEDYTSRTTECFYAYITDQLDKNNARGKLKKKKSPLVPGWKIYGK